VRGLDRETVGKHCAVTTKEAVKGDAIFVADLLRPPHRWLMREQRTHINYIGRPIRNEAARAGAAP
jgi:hypothetical protein